MHELPDGQPAVAPTLPGRRYWLGVLLGIPVAGAAVIALGVWAGLESGGWLIVGALVIAVVAPVPILRERRVRLMSGARRAIWVVVGVTLGGALAMALASVILFAYLLVACRVYDSCLN